MIYFALLCEPVILRPSVVNVVTGFGENMGLEQLQHFTRTKAVWLTL